MAINSHSKCLKDRLLRSLSEKTRKKRQKILPYPAH
jgi:hypothetical protein